MAWVQTEKGIKFEGATPYGHWDELKTLLGGLKGQPTNISSLSSELSNFIDTHEASKYFIEHLSKWCFCKREQKTYKEVSDFAFSLANKLFFGDVCPRLLDSKDIPEPGAADIYKTWIEKLKNQNRATQIMDTLILDAALELSNAYAGHSYLRFPEYQNNAENAAYDTRVSEQESKMVLAKQLFENHIHFAVEVPTTEKYGVLSKSGRFDLLIYRENEKDKFEWAIELKAHNPTTDSIKNDFIKLMGSDTNCLWFLTLRNANDNTYKRLLEKVNEVLKDTQIKENYKFKIAFVDLTKGELRLKTLNFTDGVIANIASINDFDKKNLLDIINGQ